MRRGPKALAKWQSCETVKSRPLEALMGIIAMLESPKKQAATPTGSGLAPKGAMISNYMYMIRSRSMHMHTNGTY